jgi:hypothetical protein
VSFSTATGFFNNTPCASTGGILVAVETQSENNLAFKSSRPIYAIILLVVSVFFMCTTFLPFSYSVVFPNENLQGFITALEGREPPPLDSDTVVQQTIAAVGALKRTIKIGHGYQVTTQIHYADPRTIEKIKVSQDINIAWFEKQPKPMVVAFACYEHGNGQKDYGISEVNPLVVVREYAIPLVFFAVSLFLARKRKASDSTSVKDSRRNLRPGYISPPSLM